MKCKYCKTEMRFTEIEDDDYENPFGGGYVCFICPKCGAESPKESYGFGQGSSESARNRLSDITTER